MSVLFKALEKAARQNAAAQDTAAGTGSAAAGWDDMPAAPAAGGRGRTVVRIVGLLFLAATAVVLAGLVLYSDDIERMLADAMVAPVAPVTPVAPVVAPADPAPVAADPAPQPAVPEAVAEAPATAEAPAAADAPAPADRLAAAPAADDAAAPAADPAPVVAAAPPAVAQVPQEPDAVDPDDDIALLMQLGAARRGAAPASAEPAVPAVTPPVVVVARPDRVTVEDAFGIRQAAVDGLQVSAPAVVGRDAGSTGVGGVTVATIPMETQASLAEAYTALVRGNHASALESYAAVAAREPDNVAALAGQAAALHKLRRLDEARAAYEQVLARQPDHREALTNMIALIGDSSPRDAIRRLEALQAQAPDFSPVPAQLGMLHARLGDVDRAAAALRRAIALSPDNALYHYNLAVVSDRAGRHAEAAQAYEHVLRLIAGGAAAGMDPRPIQERLAFLRAGR